MAFLYSGGERLRVDSALEEAVVLNSASRSSEFRCSAPLAALCAQPRATPEFGTNGTSSSINSTGTGQRKTEPAEEEPRA
jgi:hypothetical protein